MESENDLSSWVNWVTNQTSATCSGGKGKTEQSKYERSKHKERPYLTWNRNAPLAFSFMAGLRQVPERDEMLDHLFPHPTCVRP